MVSIMAMRNECGDIHPLAVRSVGDIISRGGTFLGSARYPEFAKLEGQLKGMKQR